MSIDDLYKQAVLRSVPSLWKLNKSCAYVSWAPPCNEPNFHASFLKQDTYLCVFSRAALIAASNIEIHGFLAGWRSTSLVGVFFCLAGVSCWLAGVVFVWQESPLVGWISFLAGWSLLLAGRSLFLAGWSVFLARWNICFLAGWRLHSSIFFVLSFQGCWSFPLFPIVY